MAEKSKALKRRTYHREDEVRELIAENITNIRDWAGQGLSNGQIAAKFGVTNSAFWRWRQKIPEIDAALKEGGQVINDEVENALYRSAVGYEYEETEITNDGHARKIKKVQHPNVNAIQFWLKNKRPETWRDKNEIELSGEVKSIFEELAKDK